ncbi:hypothetical protein [Dyella sp.]|uniref:hypothetical protein n=1 Tax=Dyella sp. TaxID=1869338 RepID=UPI002ED4A86F
MVFLRHFLAAGIALLALPALHATDVSMADGRISFTTPDSWVGIMETQGDPEVRVFQVPDPSPTASNSLARVTITVKQVADAAGYKQYMDAATEKAKGLSGYKAITSTVETRGPSTYEYTAQENNVQFAYVERYWLKGSQAIQLRCMRPVQSQAGAGWRAEFDKGCGAIATSLQK